MDTITELIRQHQPEILERWSSLAARAASARGLDAPALRNIIASYLSALADRLDASRRERDLQRDKHVESHLATRLRQGFQLSEIIDEFSLLERCIASVWQDTSPDRPPDVADREHLHAEVQHAMTSVADMFTAHMISDEQTEKRYARMLSQIAREALHPENPALRERLHDVLEVVMEAMNAQSAAFLLTNTGGHLVTVATAGAEEFERYVTALDASSFAAAVARSQETTELADVETTKLDVPDALRRSGIHALIGIRLPPHHGLVGVLYVGYREARAITPEEARRLEALGGQLLVHLDNAALFARLTDTIRELRDERELRDNFVAVLAHDLRGPLAATKLAADLLASDSRLLPTSRETASRILRNADRADRMISDLLDVHRLHAGQPIPLELAACDLCEIANDVVEELRASAPAQLTLQCPVPVRGFWSAAALQRALWNLVGNAIKHGSSDQPITVTVTSTAERARVVVHNWGPPIPIAEQADLFEPFTRARAATQAGRAGWGLGLALVRGCAEAHGGTASVTSSTQAGTSFVLDLPLDALGAQRAPASAVEH